VKSSPQYYVYILANRRNGTLYTGVTNDLRRRVLEHKDGTIGDFTEKYQVKLLVYFERHNDIERAIRREKSIKRWRRKWKLGLVESMNPHWVDLYEVYFPNRVSSEE